MNMTDILKYGHQHVLGAVDGLPDSAWHTTGVVGVWCVKDIIAHLTSFEHVLVDVFTSQLTGGATPHLSSYQNDQEFNDNEVAKRKYKTHAEVLAEYTETQAKTMDLVAQIPEAKRRTAGTIPWYGAEYSLDDLVVYAFYGHKREHCAQIKLFRKRLGA